MCARLKGPSPGGTRELRDQAELSGNSRLPRAVVHLWPVSHSECCFLLR